MLGDTFLVFSKIEIEDTDVIFICSGHGKSIDFITQNKIPKALR